MKYEELIKKITTEIEANIAENKRLYDNEEENIGLYNLHLMGREYPLSMSFDIQSNHSFKEVCSEVDKMKTELKKHRLCEIEEPSLEIEDNDWAGFYYRLVKYIPINNFDDFREWKQKDILKERIAKELGLSDRRYMRCEVLELYKENIITIEQLKKAHNVSC